jgi:hypothetical protein
VVGGGGVAGGAGGAGGAGAPPPPPPPPPPPEVLGTRGDLSGACAEANTGEEGGSWGKRGFPHASEAKPSEVAA